MILNYRPAYDQLLLAIEHDLSLKIRDKERTLLSGCIDRTPRFVSFVLAAAICFMEYFPVIFRFRPFSKLSLNDQKKFLERYRFLKFFGVSQTVQFLQTHAILASHEHAANE